MKKKILLVEYAAASIDTIKELFSHPLFEITVVEEGDAAKKMLTQNRYDLMITAAMLPKFHGFNLSYHTAANFPNLKIIIISEIYKGMEYKQQAINQYKADDFFEKPLEKEKFKKRALELLGVNENDLAQENLFTPSRPPIPDTRKIPTIRKLKEDEKQLSSEDLFGDLLEDVQENKPFEIKLEEEMQKDTGPHVIKTEKKAPEDADILVTRQMPLPSPSPSPALTQMLKKDAAATQVLPDLDSLAREANVTRPIKAAKPGEGASTRKIDIDLDELFKTKKEDIKENRETLKFKKIEDDISKKFEDTLSGLGIKGKGAQLKDTATRPIKIEETLAQKARELETQEKDEKKNELGGYDIIGLIARGGMAEIYKAKRKGVKGFEKIIALKKILAGYGKDDKYIEMFVDEAKIAAELTHPNIVQIYDLGEKDDYYFIAMEYVSGKDLRLILRKLSDSGRLLPEELSLYLVLEVLKALNYAHSAKDSSGKNLDIVHRDISPPNILVAFNGDVKLTDFGVSKASIKMHQTVAGALKGKLLYMSPEQARAEKDTDHRSDLYSVGIIFFELITGEKLFMDSSDIAVLHKVQNGEIIKPGLLKKDIDPQLEFIILRMLNKDKTKRYQKASDIINDLHAYLVRNYDRTAAAAHLSHAIYDLFKDEIEKEGIKIDLKPIPYNVNRLQRIEMEPPPTPTTTLLTQVITPPVEKEPQKLEKQDTLVEPEEDFHPLVEIEFEDEQGQALEQEQDAATTVLERVESPAWEDGAEPEDKDKAPESPAIRAEMEFSALSELQVIKDEENRKRKKYLYIALAVIIILGALIAYYLITGKGTPIETTEPAPQTGTVETGTTAAEPPAADAADDAAVEAPKTTGETRAKETGAPQSTPPTSPTPPTQQPEVKKEPPANENIPEQKIKPQEEAKQEPIQEPPVVQEALADEQVKKTEEAQKQPEAEQNKVSEGDIIALSEVDTPPVGISTPAVEITPLDTRTLRADEMVMAGYLVDHNGNVVEVRLIKKSSAKKINTAIEKTIAVWKFKPAIKNNVRVKVWKTISLTIKK
ncbi:MAG: protein kinase [Candidatus Aminicenantes bacterium]|nr:protein kinase [Candidatus Aminicenantes bacterium]